MVGILEDELTGFQQLQAPAGDEDEVNAIVDELQKQVDAVKADPGVLRISAKAIAIGKPFRQAAGDYGIASCQNPDPTAAG